MKGGINGRKKTFESYSIAGGKEERIKIILGMKIPLKFIKCTYFNFRKPIPAISLIFN